VAAWDAEVTVTGKDFTGATAVLVSPQGAPLPNETRVAPTVLSDTMLTFKIPNTASSGKILVLTPSGGAPSTQTLTVR
jgi:hypothetical protein